MGGSHRDNDTVAMTDQHDAKQHLSWNLGSRRLRQEKLLGLLTACVFLLARWRRGPVHLDLLSQEKKAGESKHREEEVRPAPRLRNTGSFFSFVIRRF